MNVLNMWTNIYFSLKKDNVNIFVNLVEIFFFEHLLRRKCREITTNTTKNIYSA